MRDCTSLRNHVIHVKERDNLHRYLQEKGIQTAFHYPIPTHFQKPLENSYVPGDFPNAEYNAAHCLSLPMYAELKEQEIRYICKCIKDFTELGK